MLIPKCCKNCSGRGNGVCNCTLPIYCQEYVEDEETCPTNVGRAINTSNTTPYVEIVDGTRQENKKEWSDFEPTCEQSIDNWAECQNCKEKDHRIAVLERALKNTCWLLYGTYDEHYSNHFIKQAEKELEEKK